MEKSKKTEKNAKKVAIAYQNVFKLETTLFTFSDDF